MTEPGAADTVGPASLPDLTYEAAEGELVELISKLEAGDVPLEDSLRMWERATLLRTVCGELLTDARSRLTTTVDSTAASNTEAAASLRAAPESVEDMWATPVTAREPGGTVDEPPF